MAQEISFSLSTLSLNSATSQNEDWDRSLVLSEPELSSSRAQSDSTSTPRNSIVFPVDTGVTPRRTRADNSGSLGGSVTKGKRSLSELLKIHAEKGTDVKFSAEEASRLADVLGQWINASSSPYESEDDFFTRSHDDLSIPSKKTATSATEGRPRGQSESANSRPPSSAGHVQ